MFRFTISALLCGTTFGDLTGSTVTGFTPNDVNVSPRDAVNFTFTLSTAAVGNVNDKCAFIIDDDAIPCPATCNDLTGTTTQTPSVVVDLLVVGTATFDFSTIANPSGLTGYNLCCDVGNGGSCVRQTSKKVYVHPMPTPMPTDMPTNPPPTMEPTTPPTEMPTGMPTEMPTRMPTEKPTFDTSEFSAAPLSAAPAALAFYAFMFVAGLSQIV